ncbi:MAG: MG2 domain-containing protein [Polyangiales bacterium]
MTILRPRAVHPVLFVALAAYACGGGKEPSKAPAGAPGGKLVLAKANDVPPPAASAVPIAFKPFTPAPDLSARRPLIPFPQAISTAPKPKGTVDESGDETVLQDLLIGGAPAASEKNQPIDPDIAKVPQNVRLVIDSPYQIFSKVGTYIHVGAWLANFQPAVHAKVYVDGKLRGITDSTGTIVFRDVPDEKGAGGGSHYVQVVAGTGQGRTVGGANYHAYARTQSFERANLYVYTDRGVFSPGETVHVRAFAWRLRGDYRPFADAPVNVMLRRDGKLVSGGRVMTDKMGVAWLDLPLPTTAPEGPYELAVEHLGERATARVQIKRIVSPAVKIDHTLPRFLVRDQPTLDFEVRLAAATGEPFKSGTINVKCMDPKGNVVATESRPVLGAGPHKFSLDNERLKKMRDGFGDDQLAAVVIEVVDGATGRRDELRRDLRISHAPWRLVVETDRNEHVPGETVKVIVHATDLEQAPATGFDLEIVGSGYDEGGQGKSEKTVTAKTDDDGLAKATFTMPKGSLNITARMVKAKSVIGAGYVYASPPRAMWADVTEAVVNEKTKTPVEIRFPSQYIPSERVVHADVVDSSGALIHSFLVPINKEGNDWVAKGSFPAPSWGSMLITFFALGAAKATPTQVGLLTDGSNLPVVAARPITVTLKAPPNAAPGQQIAIDVGLEGPKMNGLRPFAIGAVIADDSMVALLDPLERTPSQVLYNPERKVMASTGSQILTWPVVQKTWGTWNYDIALPPFGFRPGTPPPPPPMAMGGKNKSKSPAKAYDMDGDLGGGGGGGYGVGTGEGYGGLATKGAAGPMPPPPPAAAPPPKAAATSAPTMPVTTLAEASVSDAPAYQKQEKAGGAKPDANAKKPEVKISIRTDFAPTSMWMPEMIVEAGKNPKEPTLARFGAKLPDTIGTQRVTVVATDDRGAVGIGKALIKVDQDVSVRSDLPAVLTQSDEVEVGVSVRNTRKDAIKGTVTISSPGGIAILGPGSSPITVAGNATSSVRFRVRADLAGSLPFTVAFAEEGNGPTLRHDSEARRLWVTPRGAPIEHRVDAKLSGQNVVAFDIERTASDLHVEADLAIAFPSAVPMIEGLEELVDEDAYMGVDPDASRVLSAIAIEGYLLRTKAPAATIARIHERLQLATSALLLEQQPDGGWGWRWDTWAAAHGLGSASSPYATTHALLALAKLRETNIPVPDAAIASGRHYLLSQLDSEGEVDVSNVAFWEGDGPAKKRAATMSAFQSIAATEKGHPLGYDDKARMDRLVEKARGIVKGGAGSEDPLTLSAATMGLWLHAGAMGHVENAKEDVENGVKALLGSYRGGYWEPSWFHAWGGRVEATRGVIELLTTVAPGTYETDLHDAVDFLLSTRPSWGAWHNAWGTAAAIEGLTYLDPTPPEKSGANVSVSVDGKVVRTVKIDPDDPFTSAAALRSVDLSSYLSLGKHDVRVAYDGNLAVPASVTVKRWTASKVDGLDLKIERALSAWDLTSGGSTTATIKIDTKVARAELIVKVPLAAGVTADQNALEAMVKKGEIAAFYQGGSLVISLHAVPAGGKTISLPLIASRKGTFTLAAATAFVPRSAAEAWSADTRVVVH